MKLVPHIGRDGAIGIAVSPERVVAAGPSPWEYAIDPARPIAEELDRAVAGLREWCGARHTSLHVALAPPLAETRLLTLPPLRGRELERVLARDAGRFFLSVAPGLVDGFQTGRDLAGRAAVLAAWGGAEVVDGLHRAAAAHGFSIARAVPAVPAWVAGAVTSWPALRGGAATLVVVQRQRVEVIRLEGGRIAALRRLPLGSRGPDASGLVELLAESSPERALVLGDRSAVAPLADALRSRGLEVRCSGDSTVSDDAMLLAAGAAANVRRPELVPFAVAEARRRDRRQIAGALWAAAAACACVTAGLDWWGLARELRHVEEQRAAVRGAVAEAIEVRDAIAAVEMRVEQLAALERSAPRWTAAVGTVAAALPPSAYLVGLQAAGDSLVLEGLAEQVGPVFDGLRNAPGILAVRAAAPVRQESRDGAPVAEHFVLVGRSASAERKAP